MSRWGEPALCAAMRPYASAPTASPSPAARAAELAASSLREPAAGRAMEPSARPAAICAVAGLTVANAGGGAGAPAAEEGPAGVRVTGGCTEV